MLKTFVTFLAVVTCLGITFAQTAPAPESDAVDCSDPGRSCSVDRNCCSGACVHGNCK